MTSAPLARGGGLATTAHRSGSGSGGNLSQPFGGRCRGRGVHGHVNLSAVGRVCPGQLGQLVAVAGQFLVEHDYPVHVALQRRRRQLVAEDALAQLDRLDLLPDRLLMRLSVLTV
jgi:hypothetical protein